MSDFDSAVEKATSLFGEMSQHDHDIASIFYGSAIASMQGEAVVHVRDAGRFGLLVEFLEGKAETLKAGDKLFTYPLSATSKIAKQDERIKELEQQLEEARKDIKLTPWRTNGLFVITFDDFIEYGRKSTKNIVNGMPWSFNFDGIPVTHETDKCYLLCRHPRDLRITPNTVLIKFSNGEYDVQDKDITLRDYPDMNYIYTAI